MCAWVIPVHTRLYRLSFKISVVSRSSKPVISVNSILYKTKDCVLNNRLRLYLEEYDFPSDRHYGFRGDLQMIFLCSVMCVIINFVYQS